jgi:hypothetical protein
MCRSAAAELSAVPSFRHTPIPWRPVLFGKLNVGHAPVVPRIEGHLATSILSRPGTQNVTYLRFGVVLLAGKLQNPEGGRALLGGSRPLQLRRR